MADTLPPQPDTIVEKTDPALMVSTAPLKESKIPLIVETEELSSRPASDRLGQAKGLVITAVNNGLEAAIDTVKDKIKDKVTGGDAFLGAVYDRVDLTETRHRATEAAKAMGLMETNARTFSTNQRTLSDEQLASTSTLRDDIAQGKNDLRATAAQLEASSVGSQITSLAPLELPPTASQQEQLAALKNFYENLQKLSQGTAKQTAVLGHQAASTVEAVSTDLANYAANRSENVVEKDVLSKIETSQHAVERFERASHTVLTSQKHIHSAQAIITALESQTITPETLDAARHSIEALQKAGNQIASQLGNANSATAPEAKLEAVTATLTEARQQQEKIPLLQEQTILETQKNELVGQLRAEIRLGGDEAPAIETELRQAQAKINAINGQIEAIDQPIATIPVVQEKSSLTAMLDKVAPTVLSEETITEYQAAKEDHAKHTALFKRAIYDAFCEKAIISHAIATGKVDRPEDITDKFIASATTAVGAAIPLAGPAAAAVGYLASHQHNAQEMQKHTDFANAIPAKRLNELAEALSSTMSYQLQDGASKLTEKGLEQLASAISTKLFENASKLNPNEPLSEQLTALAYAPGGSTIGSDYIDSKDHSKAVLHANELLESSGVRTEDGKCYSAGMEAKYGFRHGTEAEVQKTGSPYRDLSYTMAPSSHNLSKDAVSKIPLVAERSDIELQATLDHIKDFKKPGGLTRLGEGNTAETRLFKRTAMAEDLKAIVTERLENEGFTLKSQDVNGWKRHVSKEDVATMLADEKRQAVLTAKGIDVDKLITPPKDTFEPDRLPVTSVNAALDKLETLEPKLTTKTMSASLKKVVEERRTEEGNPLNPRAPEAWIDHVTLADIETSLKSKEKAVGKSAATLMALTGISSIASEASTPLTRLDFAPDPSVHSVSSPQEQDIPGSSPAQSNMQKAIGVITSIANNEYVQTTVDYAEKTADYAEKAEKYAQKAENYSQQAVESKLTSAILGKETVADIQTQMDAIARIPEKEYIQKPVEYVQEKIEHVQKKIESVKDDIKEKAIYQKAEAIYEKTEIISATLGENTMAGLAEMVDIETTKQFAYRAGYQAKKFADAVGITEKDDRTFSSTALDPLSQEQQDTGTALRGNIQKNAQFLHDKVKQLENGISSKEQPLTPLAPLELAQGASQQEQLAALKTYYDGLQKFSDTIARDASKTGREAIDSSIAVDNHLYNLANDRTQYVDPKQLTASLEGIIEKSAGFEQAADVALSSRDQIKSANAMIQALETPTIGAEGVSKAVENPQTEATQKAIDALLKAANQMAEQLNAPLGEDSFRQTDIIATALGEAQAEHDKIPGLKELAALKAQKEELTGELTAEKNQLAKQTNKHNDLGTKIAEHGNAITSKDQEITHTKQGIAAKEQKIQDNTNKLASNTQKSQSNTVEIAAKEQKIQQNTKAIEQKTKDLAEKSKAVDAQDKVHKDIKVKPLTDLWRTYISGKKTTATEKKEAKDALDTLTTEKTGIEKEKNGLVTDTSKLTTDKSQLEKDNSQMEKDNSRMKLENNQLLKEKDTLSASLPTLSEELTILQAKQSELQEAHQKSGEKLSTLQANITETQAKLSAVSKELNDKSTIAPPAPKAVVTVDTDKRQQSLERSTSLKNALTRVEATIIPKEIVTEQKVNQEEHTKNTALLKRAIYDAFCEKAIIANAVASGKVDRPQDVIDQAIGVASMAADSVVPMAKPATAAAKALVGMAYDARQAKQYADFAAAVPAAHLNEIAEKLASTMAYQLQDGARLATENGIDQLADAITSKIFNGADKVDSNNPDVVGQLTKIAYAPTSRMTQPIRTYIEAKESGQRISAEGMLERSNVRTENGQCYGAEGSKPKYGFRNGTAEEVAQGGSRFTDLGYTIKPPAHTISLANIENIPLEGKPSDINIASTLENIKSFKVEGESLGLGERANKSENVVFDQFNKAISNIKGQDPEVIPFKIDKMETDLKEIVTKRLEGEGFALRENDTDGWKRYALKEDVTAMLETGGRKEVLEKKGISTEQLLTPPKAVIEENLLAKTTVEKALNDLKAIGQKKHGDGFSRKVMSAELDVIVRERMKESGIPLGKKEDSKQHVTADDIQQMLDNPKRKLPAMSSEALMQATGLKEISVREEATVIETPSPVNPALNVEQILNKVKFPDYVSEENKGPERDDNKCLDRTVMKAELSAIVRARTGEARSRFAVTADTAWQQATKDDIVNMLDNNLKRKEIVSNPAAFVTKLVTEIHPPAVEKEHYPATTSPHAVENQSQIEDKRDPKKRELLNKVVKNPGEWESGTREMVKVMVGSMAPATETLAKSRASEGTSTNTVTKGNASMSTDKAAEIAASKKTTVPS